MIYLFLFFHLFSFVHGDCLEFVTTQSASGCELRNSEKPDSDLDKHYPKCLQCRIQTFLDLHDVQVEKESLCSSIALQCIQMEFDSTEMFEHFFRLHYRITNSLFTLEKSQYRSTLHVIIKTNTLEEINAEYIEKIFLSESHSYRVLFLELFLAERTIIINRNLLNITRLSTKIILNCDIDAKPMQTIYVFHNGNVTLESREDLCGPIIIPSSSTISQMIVTTTSAVVVMSVRTTTEISSSLQMVPLTSSNSKKIFLIIGILASCLLCSLLTLLLYCSKYRQIDVSVISDSVRRSSIEEVMSIKTPEPVVPQPVVPLKVKQPLRGMRAVQLLEDDI